MRPMQAKQDFDSEPQKKLAYLGLAKTKQKRKETDVTKLDIYPTI